MSKAILLGLFALFVSFPSPAQSQTTGGRNQTLTNVKNQKDPISAARSSSVASTELGAEAKKFYLEGLKLAEAGQFPEAAENFRQAVKLDSEYTDAYSELGRMYFKMREWQKAVDNLRRAIDLRAKQGEARQSLHQQPAMQARDESGTSEKTNLIASQTTVLQDKKTNNAAVKPVQPGATSVPSERRQEAGVPTKPEVKREQATNANTAAVKPVQPGPTTMPAARRQETGVPLKPEVKRELKQQPTNANTAGVKTLQAQSQTSNANTSAAIKQPLANAGDARVKSLLPPSEGTADPKEPAAKAPDQRQEAVGVRTSMQLTPSSQPLETNSSSSTSAAAANDDLSLTKTYRVGPNDVLDVRLNDSESARSTLFTITPSGLLEYPVLNEPLLVSGLTVEEIGTKIEGELKTRALVENAKVNVWVRDYASHSILVSGLAKEPGTKFLRREAVPLYVVVADAQPAPEAARVTLVRNEQHKIYEIDLTQAADMNLLVRQGDVITLQPNVTQFVYIGGEVKNAGEKTFRRGLTLTQLIITAGGLTEKGRFAEIDRDDGRGFLAGSRFSLKDIRSGKAADPLLKPGDRVMIVR